MSKINKKKGAKAPEIDDSRFKEISNDPRYLEMPQKAKKISIDKKRFGKLFDKKSEFNTIGKFDKTGKRIDIKDKTMEKYYKVDKESKKQTKPDDSQESEVEESGEDESQ